MCGTPKVRCPKTGQYNYGNAGNKSAPAKIAKFKNGDKVYKAQSNGTVGQTVRIQYTAGYIDRVIENGGYFLYTLQGYSAEIEESHLYIEAQVDALVNQDPRARSKAG